MVLAAAVDGQRFLGSVGYVSACWMRGPLLQPGEFKMKTIAIVLSLAVSGIAVSAAYTSAYATRMNGKGSMCSDGSNCMSARYKMATKKPQTAKPKKGY
jgi:hypothetical protein